MIFFSYFFQLFLFHAFRFLNIFLTASLILDIIVLVSIIEEKRWAQGNTVDQTEAPPVERVRYSFIKCEASLQLTLIWFKTVNLCADSYEHKNPYSHVHYVRTFVCYTHFFSTIYWAIFLYLHIIWELHKLWILSSLFFLWEGVRLGDGC